jgi:hypothetical protein
MTTIPQVATVVQTILTVAATCPLHLYTFQRVLAAAESDVLEA